MDVFMIFSGFLTAENVSRETFILN